MGHDGRDRANALFRERRGGIEFVAQPNASRGYPPRSRALVNQLRSLVLLLLVPSVAPAVRAQGASEVARPRAFAELSASAQRVRDSVRARVASRLADVLVRPGSVEQEARLRDSLVAAARAQLGTRYRLGAQHPGGAFDCSGLVRFVLSALHLDLPRTARDQALAGQPIARDTAQLRPGDLLTFGTGRVTHIGIYVGDGRFIHASSSRRQVVESYLGARGSWFARNWLGVRRVVAAADATN